MPVERPVVMPFNPDLKKFPVPSSPEVNLLGSKPDLALVS